MDYLYVVLHGHKIQAVVVVVVVVLQLPLLFHSSLLHFNPNPNRNPCSNAPIESSALPIAHFRELETKLPPCKINCELLAVAGVASGSLAGSTNNSQALLILCGLLASFSETKALENWFANTRIYT